MLLSESDLLQSFKDWVNNLMMPYFYENGGFRMVGGESEEEMQLKAKMVDFACNLWRLKPCLVDAQTGWTEKKRSTAT